MTEATVETIWGHGGPYLSRAIWGPLRFHIFHRPDQDPDLHDHPADFWTFPLVSYVEEFINKHGELDARVVKAFRLHRRKAEHAHRVLGPWDGQRLKIGRWGRWEALPTTRHGQVATILWWGKKRREWGFRTETGEWIPWRKYRGCM